MAYVICADVVLAIAVSEEFGVSISQTEVSSQTHPLRNIMASASMEKDLTIRLWFDE